MKKFEEYNESIRDKMTPSTENDMKRKMGDEIYNNYISMKKVVDSIKEPFVTDGVELHNNEPFFYINGYHLSSYKIKIKEGKWIFEYRIGYNYKTKQYDTFEEIMDTIKNITKDDIQRDIDRKQDEISDIQNSVNSLEKMIVEIDEKV